MMYIYMHVRTVGLLYQDVLKQVHLDKQDTCPKCHVCALSTPQIRTLSSVGRIHFVGQIISPNYLAVRNCNLKGFFISQLIDGAIEFHHCVEHDTWILWGAQHGVSLTWGGGGRGGGGGREGGREGEREKGRKKEREGGRKERGMQGGRREGSGEEERARREEGKDGGRERGGRREREGRREGERERDLDFVA